MENAGWWVAPKSQTSGPFSTENESSLLEQTCVGCHFFWGLPWFGLGHPWDCPVTADEHRSQCTIFPTPRVVLVFSCACFDVTQWRIITVDGPIILCWDFTCQHIHRSVSEKWNKGLKAAAHPTERRNYILTRRVGTEGLLLLQSYFCSTGSFQREGRGNWCVKTNYRRKNIIYQTTCWLQSH